MEEKATSSSLRHSARKGWLWGGLDQFVQRGLTTIVGLVLARLLEPEAFGLVASVAIFINIAAQVIDGGIVQRVLQKTEIREEDYTALFWSNAAVSILCVGALAFSADLIAGFYGQPQLKQVVVALAGVLFFMNAGRVQEARLLRELRFRASSLIRSGSILVGCTVGLIMALRGFGIWAIIGQQAAHALTRSTVLWMAVPWRPTQKPSFKAIIELYRFGLPVLLGQVLYSISGNLINVLMAKRVSVTELGYFNRGQVIPQSLGGSLTNMFTRINFPVLSKLQEHEEEFKSLYLHFLRVKLSVYIIIMAGVFVGASDLITVLLGERWLPSVWYLRAGCIGYLFFVFNASNGELLRAKGLTGLFFRNNLFMAICQIGGVLAGMSWGAQGMVIGDICARMAVAMPIMVISSRRSHVTVLHQLKAWVEPLCWGAAVVLLMVSVQFAASELWWRFSLYMVVGAIIASLYAVRLWRGQSHVHTATEER